MLPMPGWAIIEPEEKTREGDIYLPEAAKTEMQRGTIISIDPAVYGISGIVRTLELKEGDKVAFVRYHDQDLEADGKKYKVVPTDKIMLKF